MKTKNKIVLSAVVLAAFGGVFSLGSTGSNWLSASVILGGTAPAQFSYAPESTVAAAVQEELSLQTTNKAPLSPDFLNTFNLYSSVKSERALMETYADMVKGGPSDIHDDYAYEIMSFVDRVSKNPNLSNKLPMWPKDNMATFGNVLAYIFANEANPMLFAKATGLVPVDAKSSSYMSRAEVLYIISKLFISPDRNPTEALASVGFIESEDTWKNPRKDGFLLVEAIRLVLDIRELIERSNILQAREQYEQGLVALPQGGAELNKNSMRVLLKAFAQEVNPERAVSVVPRKAEDLLNEWFKGMYGQAITASLVTELRGSYYSALGMEVPAVYELPPLVDAGNCANEMFRKTYMGAVAVTGSLGSIITCDGGVIIHLPENSYLLNVFSLPKITALVDSANPTQTIFRTDALRSYGNALIVSSRGEEKVRVFYKPENFDAVKGGKYQVQIADHDGHALADFTDSYGEKGALIFTHLRAFTGDNMFRFNNVR